MELSAGTAMVYVRSAFDQMLAVVDRLGDPLINDRPLGEWTNAVAPLVIHCCGVAEFWLGHVALGRPSDRARDDEFAQTATVAQVHDLVARTLATIEADLDQLDAGGGTDEGGRQFLPGGDVSDASAVLHVIEECYQHLGHIELAADALTHAPPPPDRD